MKTKIKKRNTDITEGLFVHNMLCELANGCSAVQAADSFGQHGIISQELYDYVYELIGNGELKVGHGWIMNVHNSVGFSSHNESYFFTYEGEITPFGGEVTPFDAELVHHFCMVECSYTIFEGGYKFDSRNEKTYNLYIPWYDVQIDQDVNKEGMQRVNVEVRTPAFAKAMPLDEYAKLVGMISKHSFIPHLAMRITYFNKSGIEKIEKKMLELALKKYNKKPE